MGESKLNSTALKLFLIVEEKTTFSSHGIKVRGQIDRGNEDYKRFKGSK